jgi:hypothetical protein
VEKNVCTRVSKGAANDGALAGYDVLGAVLVDMVLQIEPKNLDRTQRAGRQTVGTQPALVFLEILPHQRDVAVLAAHSVVQAALVVVLLRNVQTTVAYGTLDRRVFAVEHDVVVDVDAVVDPVTAGLAVGALDYELVEHVLDDLWHGPQVSACLDVEAAGGARLAAIGLGRPGMLEAVVAEVVLAGQLDGLVEGRVADEADEVAVGRRHVLERGELGRDFDGAAAAALRRG